MTLAIGGRAACVHGHGCNVLRRSRGKCHSRLMSDCFPTMLEGILTAMAMLPSHSIGAWPAPTVTSIVGEWAAMVAIVRRIVGLCIAKPPGEPLHLAWELAAKSMRIALTDRRPSTIWDGQPPEYGTQYNSRVIMHRRCDFTGRDVLVGNNASNFLRNARRWFLRYLLVHSVRRAFLELAGFGRVAVAIWPLPRSWYVANLGPGHASGTMSAGSRQIGVLGR